MLLQWRSGLRTSEALALEAADLSMDSDQATIRVRQGKGIQSRIVPIHPELQNALTTVFQIAEVGRSRMISASQSTAWRWAQAAADRAVDGGTLPTGWQSYFPTLLRPSPFAAWSTHHQPVPLAGPSTDSNNTNRGSIGSRPGRPVGRRPINWLGRNFSELGSNFPIL